MLKQEEFSSKRDQIIQITNALKYHYNQGDFLDVDKNFNLLLEKIMGIFDKDDIITEFIANEELHHKYKLKYEEAVEYIKLLELNKLDKKVSFDKFSNHNNQHAENNELDKSLNSAFSFEKLVENGDHYYISDSSELGYKHRIKKNLNLSLSAKENLNKAEEKNQTNETKNLCIYGMEPEKLRDEYIRIFEEKKKIEHEYLILLDKVPMLELSEKNYQEAQIQIESLSEKNKQMTNEISTLKDRLTTLGIENAELMDLNHQYCEAIACFNSQSENVKSKNIIECTKTKKLEQELTNAHRKLSELEMQIEKINCKRIKELEERNYIEKRYEDIIYEQENALANIVLDQDKIYKESLIEKLFDENNNELTNKFNFTYNQATDKIEIFFDEEKVFDIENLENKNSLKKFNSMNLMKCRDINEIPEKTKNKILSDFSFSYFESEDSNDEKNIGKNFIKEFNNASTKEPSRPSDPYSTNTPQTIHDYTDIPFKDITAVESKFKKKNLSCQLNQKFQNFMKKYATPSNENCNIFGSFNPKSINDLSYNNTLKSFLQNKSASFKNPNNVINLSRNKESSELNNLDFTCGNKSKRKSMSSSFLNKIINENYSQIKNDNSKSLSSFINKDKELKKFYTPINLKNLEELKTQKSMKSIDRTNNPVVSQFSLANSINEKLVDLSTKSSNFKSRLSIAMISRNKTEKLLSTLKNKLFNNDNTQNFILENLHINQTLENEANTDKMNLLGNQNNFNNNENQNIDNPLFKSNNSSFLNDNSFNSKVIRRTTLDNYNNFSSKRNSLVNRNFDELKKNNSNNSSLIRKTGEVLEANSNNSSCLDCESYHKNLKSNYFTLADKKYILEDLVEEDKCVRDFNSIHSGKEENQNENKDKMNTTPNENMSTINFCNQEDQQNDKPKHFIIDDFDLLEANKHFERHFTFNSGETLKKGHMEIEQPIKINIESRKNLVDQIKNKDNNFIFKTPLSKEHLTNSKEQSNGKRVHRKSLSYVTINKIDIDNFKSKINLDFVDNMKNIENDLHNHNKDQDSNQNLNEFNDIIINNIPSEFNPTDEGKESIFEKIRKDLLLSCKKSGNINQINNINCKTKDEKSYGCKHKGVCHKHVKINKALNRNKSRSNFDSILLNTDFIKKSNLSMGFNPIKSFQEEDDNEPYNNKENDIKNRINKLDLKPIKSKFDKGDLVNELIRKSIANTTLKNEFLNELKLNKQKSLNTVKNNPLKEEDPNQKRLNTNITTNNHYWKYTINLIPSRDSSFNNKLNSHRSQNNNDQIKEMNISNNKDKKNTSGFSEHLNISIISDCNPAILDENNNENQYTNEARESKFNFNNSFEDFKNNNHLPLQKGFNEVTIESQINNFCIASNFNLEHNSNFIIERSSNSKTMIDDDTKSEKYSNCKFKKEKRLENLKKYENVANYSINNKSKLSEEEDNKKIVSVKKKNKLISSPYKEKEIFSGSEDDNYNCDYNNSYRSRENLLNNAYVREMYFSSSLSQKNNNLNFKINLDLKLLPNESELKIFNNMQNKDTVHAYGIDFVSEMIIQNRLNTLLDFYKKRYNIFRRPFRKDFYLAEDNSISKKVPVKIEGSVKSEQNNSQLTPNTSSFIYESKVEKEDINERKSNNSIEVQDKQSQRCDIF